MNILGSLQDYLQPKKMLASFPGQENTAAAATTGEQQPGEQEPDADMDDSTLNPRSPSAPKQLMTMGSWDNYLRKQGQQG